MSKRLLFCVAITSSIKQCRLSEHSLKVSDYQTSVQKQQEQVNSWQLQIDKMNDELETLVSVYYPYRGKVRRVKVLNQSVRRINVEVTLDIRGGK